MTYLLTWLYSVVLILTTSFLVDTNPVVQTERQVGVAPSTERSSKALLYRCKQGETFLATYFVKDQVKYVYVKNDSHREDLLSWSSSSDQGDVYIGESLKWEAKSDNLVYFHLEGRMRTLTLITKVSSTQGFYNETNCTMHVNKNCKAKKKSSSSQPNCNKTKLVRTTPHRYL